MKLEIRCGLSQRAGRVHRAILGYASLIEGVVEVEWVKHESLPEAAHAQISGPGVSLICQRHGAIWVSYETLLTAIRDGKREILISG